MGVGEGKCSCVERVYLSQSSAMNSLLTNGIRLHVNHSISYGPFCL